MRMRRIYKKVAKQYDVPLDEVELEMQKAISAAWKNPPNDGGMTAAYWRRIPRKGEHPTPEELIKYVARQVAGSTGGLR